MSQQDRTVAALLNRLIEIEKASQLFYFRLSEMFAHEPKAAEIWWMMAADEASHIQLLEQAREGLTPEQLAAPATPQLLRAVREAAVAPPEEGLASIQTLEDAYQLAHAAEHSEINTVFEAVISELFPVSVQRAFVQSQLREHTGRLDRLEPSGWRRGVAAKHPAGERSG